MNLITSELVENFWIVMANKYNFWQVDKSSSEFMKTVGDFLDVIGIIDKSAFMDRFTTTIYNKIHTPFIVGVAGSAGYDLWEQLSICVHECVHVTQFKKEQIKMPFLYLTSQTDRATYEAEALSAEMEFYFWGIGAIPNIKKEAANLLHYGINPANIKYVEKYLETVAKTVEQGASVSKVAAFAIEWLEKQGVKH